jgi:multiple sugar transport system ATP-binding protein
MARLELRNLFKSYGTYEAVRGIDLEIDNNEFVVFVGPSGCGKSTTLRMIAGLEHISRGDIIIGDTVVNRLGPGRRDIAMVFQNYALYPHMSVRENMSFCLEQQRLPKAEIARRIGEAAATLHISDLLDRRPGQLSGGQRQRVAMGRAIVRNPKVFLFDEPLSNLDAQLRVQMRTEIKRLHQLLPTTTVYVTHDQIEAMTMADRVVVMNAGLIEQAGPPQELYHRPVSRFVAGFIGSPSMNFLEGDLRLQGERLVVRLRDGCDLPVPETRFSDYAHHAGEQVVLGIRPESITERQARPGYVDFEAKIDLVEPLGSESMVYFGIAGASMCGRIGADASPRALSTMELSFNMAQMHLFDAESGRTLLTE